MIFSFFFFIWLNKKKNILNNWYIGDTIRLFETPEKNTPQDINWIIDMNNNRKHIYNYIDVILIQYNEKEIKVEKNNTKYTITLLEDFHYNIKNISLEQREQELKLKEYKNKFKSHCKTDGDDKIRILKY